MPCADWVTWAEDFGIRDEEMEWIVEYAAYTLFAVCIHAPYSISDTSQSDDRASWAWFIASIACHGFYLCGLNRQAHGIYLVQIKYRFEINRDRK